MGKKFYRQSEERARNRLQAIRRGAEEDPSISPRTADINKAPGGYHGSVAD